MITIIIKSNKISVLYENKNPLSSRIGKINKNMIIIKVHTGKNLLIGCLEKMNQLKP